MSSLFQLTVESLDISQAEKMLQVLSKNLSKMNSLYQIRSEILNGTKVIIICNVIYDPHDTVDKSTKSGADYKIEIP